MNKKIKCVLLVDDDEATNFIHKLVLTKADFTEHIATAENGQEALDYLMSINGIDYKMPDFIFLDINMPVMNGWQFLENYRHLDDAIKRHIRVILLTTSLNPDDKVNAEFNENVDLFVRKPMTIEILKELQLDFAH